MKCITSARAWKLWPLNLRLTSPAMTTFPCLNLTSSHASSRLVAGSSFHLFSAAFLLCFFFFSLVAVSPLCTKQNRKTQTPTVIAVYVLDLINLTNVSSVKQLSLSQLIIKKGQERLRKVFHEYRRRQQTWIAFRFSLAH